MNDRVKRWRRTFFFFNFYEALLFGLAHFPLSAVSSSQVTLVVYCANVVLYFLLLLAGWLLRWVGSGWEANWAELKSVRRVCCAGCQKTPRTTAWMSYLFIFYYFVLQHRCGFVLFINSSFISSIFFYFTFLSRVCFVGLFGLLKGCCMLCSVAS